MAILKDLQKLLEKNKVKHEVIDHRTVFTALDNAKTQHIDPKEVVKTLVMKIDAKRHILALIPANKNLDKKKLLKEVNKWLKKKGEKTVKAVEFAKENWMRKNLKGKVGATIPLGSLNKMTAFIDKSLLKNKNLVINSGDYERSVKMATKKFIEIEDMIKGAFSEAKKKMKKR
ncbi:MAG: YbaK/EbsC family protein [Candidatus Paceibacterota bacterium]|jgi:prolyl-tRNA editing enzyme YbaK/EbsC (Cys-tRNA(Pro) deacylase)